MVIIMRKVDVKTIQDSVADMVRDAAIMLRPDVLASLKKAASREKDPRAQETLEIIIENASAAKKNKVPLCQDTGMTVVYCEIGRDLRLDCDIEKAITDGIKKGTRAGALRRSIVKDPLTRINTGSNTPVIIHYRFTTGERLKLSVLLKGFGCENKGQVVMFNPTASISQITAQIVRIVKEAGANACPPFIVGVGIGGTMDTACALAKEALLRKVGVRHRKKQYAALERDLLKKINALNIGPLGLSGRTTALDVKIKEYPTHIAGLPVAVNISCHALRSKTIII